MRALFLGNSQWYSKAALQTLHEVGIEVANDLRDLDLVLSYGYPKRIPVETICAARVAAINFHPAPLPEWRGMGGVYNVALYEGAMSWGVSAHYLTEDFDSGDIIQVDRFGIDSETETAKSLKTRSHTRLLRLFKEIAQTVLLGKQLPRIPQGKGRYISKEDFESLRHVDPNEPVGSIKRKIRAFWCPPHHGACITIGKEEFTLIDKDLLGGL